MITIETLQIINGELEAEHAANVNKERIKHKNELTRKRCDWNNLKLVDEPLEVSQQHESDSQSRSEIKVEDTEQMTIYNQIMHFYGILGFFFGCTIRYDWKMGHHPMFWIANIFLFFTVFSIGYTVFYHFRNGDYLKIIEPLAILGETLSCVIKWFVQLRYWRRIYALVFVPKKLCLENVTGTRTNILIAGLRRTSSVLKTYAMGVIAVLGFYGVVPAKFFLFDGIRMPLMPVEVLFCDRSTLQGFLYANVIHLITGFYGGIATIKFGTGFLMCVCNYTFLIDLIEQDFKELNDMWTGASTSSIAHRHAFLDNIAKKLQDLRFYMKEVKGIYELKFFIYFLLSYSGQVICLYQITENNWIPGYTIAGTVFVEMMFYCIVG